MFFIICVYLRQSASKKKKKFLCISLCPLWFVLKGKDILKSKIFRRLKKFFIEVEVEMKKVSWTTKKELIASTSVVVIAALLIALFVFLVDIPLSRLIELILRYGV